MKIKAKGGKLERIPGGLSYSLIQSLNKGKTVDVVEIPHKLITLVEEVSIPKIKTKKESE
mgnify:CR=1 FL=1|jgi:hypothetical protein